MLKSADIVAICNVHAIIKEQNFIHNNTRTATHARVAVLFSPKRGEWVISNF
jgi:hypothetical protein